LNGAPTALVVDADHAERHNTVKALRGAGFTVTSADTFALGKSLLLSIKPQLVVADIKLGAYNGLHLAAYCSLAVPSIPVIATHEAYDAALDADAGRLSAVYVVRTPTREGLIRAACKLLESGEHVVARRSDRKQAPAQTTVQVAASNAEVLDVSYGGARLKLPEPARLDDTQHEPPVAFDVVFPDLDLSLHAMRVWAVRDDRGGWFCGTEFAWDDSTQLLRWREFVDSVR